MMYAICRGSRGLAASGGTASLADGDTSYPVGSSRSLRGKIARRLSEIHRYRSALTRAGLLHQGADLRLSLLAEDVEFVPGLPVEGVGARIQGGLVQLCQRKQRPARHATEGAGDLQRLPVAVDPGDSLVEQAAGLVGLLHISECYCEQQLLDGRLVLAAQGEGGLQRGDGVGGFAHSQELPAE